MELRKYLISKKKGYPAFRTAEDAVLFLDQSKNFLLQNIDVKSNTFDCKLMIFKAAQLSAMTKVTIGLRCEFNKKQIDIRTDISEVDYLSMMEDIDRGRYEKVKVFVTRTLSNLIIDGLLESQSFLKDFTIQLNGTRN